MSDTTPTAQPFNFASISQLMHGMAYKRAEPFKATPEQFHAFSEAMQTVQDAATCLQRTRAGINLLLDMLDGSDLEPYYSDAMRGLLGPIAQNLEQNAQALNATVGDEPATQPRTQP
jgi:hypothetical protein